MGYEIRAQADGHQIFETVGDTAISPVFETDEDLMTWLLGRYSRRAAAQFIEKRFAPAMVLIPDIGPVRGVEALAYLPYPNRTLVWPDKAEDVTEASLIVRKD
jgi:hypothetical protein